ncbi:MAG: ABC transporter permease [Rhizobiales bacterium]|nr:ABC transporter permease [Hyphomicrobiales bacterium]
MVPRNSIAGKALIVVIAIMTFLASLTTGAVVLVRAAASEWQADVTREVTVQVRPVDGRDLEADVNASVDIVRGTEGVAEVQPYSKAESARLLEPWLGGGLVLDDLPVPRLIVVRIAAGAKPDLERLRRSLREVVPSATLDDHRGWVDRMRTMAGTAVSGGVLILLLMVVATVLSVVFATRGAMAANRPIIEVLHFIGARNSFIAGRFQRHFLILGLQGGIIGGGAAILVFLVAQGLSSWFTGTAAEDQLSALFGRFSLGLLGYAALAGLIVMIALITAATSRFTVNRTLDTVE